MNTTIISQAVFYFIAFITIASAVKVVFSRSLMQSAFALLFTFFGVAALYAYLGADFLAATQMIIYVGGILVLLLFGVMLTHKMEYMDPKSETFQMWPATIVALAIFGLLAGFMLRTKWHGAPMTEAVPTTAAIGGLLMKEYMLPFEAASILLLVALIGAAMIVRRKSE